MEPYHPLKSMNTILVTNTRAFSDGNSIAADIARMLARNGRKVALIDADLRRPAIHKMFDLPNDLGLSDVLHNHRSPLSVLHALEAGNLSILTGGSHPVSNFGIFDSEKMRDHLQLINSQFDKVIIQGPAFFFTEALSLATLVDGVILLIHPGYSKTETSRAIIDKFQRTGASIAGIVMRDQPKNQAHQTAFIDRLLSFDKQVRQFS